MSAINRDIRTERALILSSDQLPLGPLASIGGLELTFCDNSHQAVLLAAKELWDFIFVHIDKAAGGLDSFLVALRQANPTAKRILLCSMIQEPRAIGLVNTRDREHLADEYIIFPVGITGWAQQHRDTNAQLSASPTAAAQSVENLKKLVVQDDLTGLKNRRYLRQFLRQILDYARTERFNVTLLLFDIDNFKHYNDRYGHPVGDEVLQQVGELIKHCCRPHDIVARIGGDEFAVIFWDLPAASQTGGSGDERRKLISEHPRETIFMAQRFRQQLSLAHPSVLGASGKGHLTISGGLASFPKDGQDEHQLFKMADQAMLYAKQTGKNRIHIVGSPQPEDKSV